MIDMLSTDYEPETRRAMSKVLKEGDSFLIAGAHQGGLASYAASLVGPQGKVYAFEPEPENYKILLEHIKPFGNVKTFNCALGDRKQEAALYICKDNTGGHALWPIGRNSVNVKTRENPEAVKVDVNVIDEFLEDEDLSKLKLCLFDAEGAELSILRGGINTFIDNDIPYIICEINDFALKNCGASQITLRAYMDMYGYRCFVLNDEGCVDTDSKAEIKKVTEDGQLVVFNVLFSRKGKV